MNKEYMLFIASNKGHTEIVKHLIAAGADVHAIDDFALFTASENGHTEIVELLKKHMEGK